MGVGGMGGMGGSSSSAMGGMGTGGASQQGPPPDLGGVTDLGDPEGDSGCGCEVAGDRREPSGWWLLLGLAAAAGVRRREKFVTD